METQEGQETQINHKTTNKTKALVIGILVVAIAVVVLVLKNPQPTENQSQKPANAPELPKQYVLENNAVKSYSTRAQTPSGLQDTKYPIETTQYTTSKTKAELVGFYKTQLVKDGWEIINESDDIQPNGQYMLSAADYKNTRNLSLLIIPIIPETSQNRVIISYTEGFVYKKR